MSFFQSLLTWANLPFTAAIATVLTFGALQASGLLGLLAADSDHDVEADADGDADADADHDLDHDGDADHDHEGRAGATSVLATVGVGRLPTTIVWQTFAMSFGLVGVSANTVFWSSTHSLPVSALALSLPVGFLGAFGLTALIAKTIGKVVKLPSEAPGKRDLVGLAGTVVSGAVDEEFGEIRVKAQHGELVQLACRVLPGERPLAQHDSVVIVKYDREHDFIYVAPGTEASDRASVARVRV